MFLSPAVIVSLTFQPPSLFLFAGNSHEFAAIVETLVAFMRDELFYVK